MREYGSGRDSLPTLAEVNITSLVDIAFTLLVIFIITAPILQGGIEVDLPEAETAPITQSEAVVVTVDRTGTVFLGEVEMADLDEFEAMFPSYVGDRGANQVYLKGDRGASYGRVLQVIGLIERLDVAGLGLVAEPEMAEGGN